MKRKGYLTKGKKKMAALNSMPPMMGGGKMKYYKHGGKTRNPFTEQYD